jgi:hypothetical protein
VKRLATFGLLLICAANCRSAPDGATLSGRVIIAGQHSRGVVVTASGPRTATAVTDANGAYQLADLVEGAYALSASVRSTVEGTRGATVEVSGDARAPDLIFTPAGGLAGRATRGGAMSGNAGILVTVEGTSALGVTDDAGNYHIDLVPAGTYDLHAQAAGYRPGSATGQVVRWDETTMVPPIDLVIGPGHGGLSGVARRFGARDHGGTRVTVVGTGLSAITASDGSWSIDSVPEGTYTLDFDGGRYRETVPQVVALAGSDGFVVDESLYPLPVSPLTLYPARRIESARNSTNGFLLSSDGQRLVYSDVTATAPALKTVRLDGSLTVKLTDGTTDSNVDDGGVAFSPDGGRVAFVQGRRLKIVDAGGGAVLGLAAGVQNFAFAPNGQALSYQGPDPMTGQPTLFVVPAQGGAPLGLASEHDITSPTWNADSTRIIYRSGIDDYFRLGTVKLVSSAGGAPAVVGGGAWDPLISPDHRRAVMQTNVNTNDGSSTLVGVDLGSGATATLAGGVSHYADPVLAGSDRVLYTVNGEIYWAAIAGGTPTHIGKAQRFRVADGGSYVAFESDCTDPNGACTLQVARLDGSAPRMIATGAWDYHISDDGALVLYATEQDNTLHGKLWVAPTASGTPRQVDERVEAYAARFTRDDSHVVYPKEVGNDSRGTLRIAPVVNGAPVTLGEGVQVYGWTFSPDGTHLQFDSQMGTVRRLLSAAIDGSAATLVVDGLTDVPKWTASGVLVERRAGTAAPYRFQDGFYSFTP